MKQEFKLKGSPNSALLAATIGFFFGAMAISLFGPTAGKLSDIMQLTPFEVGILVAIPSLSGSLLRIPMGASVDVNGGRKSFLALLIITIISLSALCYLFTTYYPDHMTGLYPVILVLGCLSGCGIATFSVGVSQVSYWFEKKKQGYALGVFGGLGTASAGVVAIVLPIILRRLGFIEAYYILSAAMLLGCIIYFLFANNAPYFQFIKRGLSAEESHAKAAESGQQLFPTGNIKESLRIGSIRDYGEDDLGKFGFGLKTASISQCRRVVVASRIALQRDACVEIGRQPNCEFPVDQESVSRRHARAAGS